VWKKGRAKLLGQEAKWIACILPFEPDCFKNFRAQSLYVGNPCVEELAKKYGEQLRPRMVKSAGDRPRIALVPGSRPQEIRRIFKSMAEAGSLLKNRYNAEIRVSTYHGLDKSLFSPHLENCNLEAFSGPLDELLAWADCAMVTSGTATLQAALMEVPHVLVYKMSIINRIAFRCFIRFPFIGLPNIIAGKEIIKECLQHEADSQPLAAMIGRFIEDPGYYSETKKALADIHRILGNKNPSEEVSEIIAGHLGNGCSGKPAHQPA
jgi:lipid-A-disaccharide synthase